MKNNKTSKTNKVNTNKEDIFDLGIEPPKFYRQAQEKNQQLKQKEKQLKTKKEIREHESKKRALKNKLRKVFIWFIIVLATIAIIIALSLTVFFHINTITIKGNNLYSKNEILAQCSIDKGDNLFLVNEDNVSKTLSKNLPYVYSVKIEKHIPDRVTLTVSEAKVTYSIKCEDKTYIYLDNNFKVLEKGGQIKKGILIKNSKLKIFLPGQEIEFKNNDTSSCLKKIAKVIKDNNFKEITEIYSKSLVDNYVVYDGRIKFKLGNCDDLQNKIYKGLAACDKLNTSSPDAEGTMTISSDKEVYFTEK